MQATYCKYIVLSVGLGCLAPGWALAQPTITRQPSDKFVDPGKNATFSLGVKGTPPYSSQWLFDGRAIAGATNLILQVTNAQPAQSGYYSAIAANASGSVTSQVARLKVFVTRRTISVALRSGPTVPQA
jgi:hypothetical protein